MVRSLTRWTRRYELLPHSRATEVWRAEDYRAGPLGLGVMDTALRLVSMDPETARAKEGLLRRQKYPELAACAVPA